MRRGPIYRSSGMQGESIRLQNRLVLSTGEALTAADVTSWSARVYCDGALVKKLVDASATTTDYFFDTLQTGNGWDKDATGYNFEYVIAGDAFKSQGGKTYRIEFEAVTADEKVRWVWMVTLKPWMGA